MRGSFQCRWVSRCRPCRSGSVPTWGSSFPWSTVTKRRARYSGSPEGPFPGRAATASHSTARTRQIAQFVQQGYNTNYAARWFLVRTGPLIRPSPGPDMEAEINYDGGAVGRDLRDFRNSRGPLTRRFCESLGIPLRFCQQFLASRRRSAGASNPLMKATVPRRSRPGNWDKSCCFRTRAPGSQCMAAEERTC